MNERKSVLRRVFKWIGWGVLILILAGSICLNIALLALVGGPAAVGGESLRLREMAVEGEGPDKVALIPIKGVIAAGYGGTLSWGRGTVPAILAQLKRAAEDRSIKGVLLEIDSPGGSVGDSDLIFHEIEKVRKAGKPVISHMQDLAASGAYYVAAASDRIIAQPTTITGNIGVIYHSLNVEELLGKVGIKDVTIKRGRFKDILSPTRTMTPEEMEILQNITDRIYDRFASVIAEKRKLDRERMEEVSDGRVFLAPEARDLGLVDEIGYRDDAIAAMCNLLNVKKVRLIRYEKIFSFREILGASSHAFSPSLNLNLRDGLTEMRIPRLMYLWTAD